MKPLLAICLAFLVACATDPTLDETEQALTDEEEGGVCSSPEAALADIETTYGAGSKEHAAGLNCWRLYNDLVDICEEDFDDCLDRGGTSCGFQYTQCRILASRYYWACVWYSAYYYRCYSPWSSDHTQDW